ncbi:MAG: FAD-dependent oxidoreductase [Gemmatimonadota bacterium]
MVGGGGSGLAAAASAARRGAAVMVLEKEPQLGGTTGIAVGSFTACRTRLQRRAGIDDEVGDHAEDAGKFAPAAVEARNNGELRRWFLGHAADTLEWLEAMGLRFHGPSPEPPNRVPRMHNAVPGAKAYIAVLQAQVRRWGGAARCGARVTELRRTGSRVSGVVAEEAGRRTEYGASRGVVLAAGDYAGSPELIRQYKGDEYREVEGINPYSTGDGHRLAAAAGARLVNMEVTYGPEIRFVAPPGRTFQQLLPSRGPLAALMGRLVPLAPAFLVNAMVRRLLVTWQHPESGLFDSGAVLVNREGARFCDETASPAREIALARQPGKIGYILLDQPLADQYSRWPHFVSTAPRIAYAYVQDYLKLRPDVAAAGPTLAAVAARRGMPAGPLEAAVAAHNQELAAAGRRPLRGDRWVLLGPAKAYFTTTEGGAAIDRQCRCLDREGQPIPGLYAVGQNGLGGQILWGHGLHIAWAITSGRLVGERLAGGEGSQ